MDFLSAPRITSASMSALNPRAKTFVPNTLPPSYNVTEKNNSCASNEPKNLDARHHVGFLDIPKELRDQIYSLAIGDDSRTPCLVHKPCEAYRSLSQVSRLVRSESADVYWSGPEREFFAAECDYSVDWAFVSRMQSLRSPSAFSRPYVFGLPGFMLGGSMSLNKYDKLTAWKDAYGKLAAQRIRRLHVCGGSMFASVKLDLVQSSAQWTCNPHRQQWFGTGMLEKVNMLAFAILSPEGQIKVTAERFATFCHILAAIERETSDMTRILSDAHPSYRENIIKHKDAMINELLTLERYVFSSYCSMIL